MDISSPAMRTKQPGFLTRISSAQIPKLIAVRELEAWLDREAARVLD
jgi:hypothetical protein